MVSVEALLARETVNSREVKFSADTVHRSIKYYNLEPTKTKIVSPFHSEIFESHDSSIENLDVLSEETLNSASEEPDMASGEDETTTFGWCKCHEYHNCSCRTCFLVQNR